MNNFELRKIDRFFLTDDINDKMESYVLYLLDSIDVPHEYKDCVFVDYRNGRNPNGKKWYVKEQQEKINKYKRILPKGTVVETRIYDHYYSMFGRTSKDTVVVPVDMKEQSEWENDVVEYDPSISLLYGDVKLENEPFTIYIEYGSNGELIFSPIETNNTVSSIDMKKPVYISDCLSQCSFGEVVSHLYNTK